MAIRERMRHPRLAATLRAIAKSGPTAFYEGTIANDMVTKLRSLGGLHTLDDFANARPDYVEPISTNYRGYDVFECPPNGQGLAALMMLNVLSGYDVGGMTDVDRIHVFAEVSKQTHLQRNKLFGDPSVEDIPVDYLLSAEWHARARGHGSIRRVRSRQSTGHPSRIQTRSIFALSTRRATRCR
jgi:gamma-glutamyltranspeptidase/glutathione hydrolase